MRYYTESDHINTTEDVKQFFQHIVQDRKINFHPDDAFEMYVSNKTHEPSFTAEECKLYNRLMEESFSVCEKENADIYEIGLDELYPDLNIA